MGSWSHVHTLEVASEELLEVLPTINHIFGQVVEPGPGCVGHADGKKLDDKEVVIHPARSTCKAIVF
jgi:hypothetical protein